MTSLTAALLAATALRSAPAQVSAKPADKPKSSSSEAGPSGEECRKWVKALEAAVKAGDADKFNALFDWDQFLDTATSLPDKSPQAAAMRASFSRGFKVAALSNKSGFAQAIIAAVRSGGSYHHLRDHTVEGKKRALFRLINPSGAVNYHDFLLGRTTDGQTVAVDCYIFLLGELYSQNARRNFLPLVGRELKGSPGLSQADKDFVTHLKDFQDLSRSAHDKNYRQVLDTYKRLPHSMQLNKTILLLRLVSAQSAGQMEYIAAIDEFRKEYPKDPLVDMVSIDGFVLHKAFDKALVCIDHLDQSVGGDPYLKVIRASVLAQQGKLTAARNMAYKGMVQEPTLANPYFLLLDLSLKTHQFDDTLRMLQALERKFKVQFRALDSVPAFTEFVKSPQYQTWLDSHKKKN